MAALDKDQLLTIFLGDIKRIAKETIRQKDTVEEAVEYLTFRFLTLIDGMGADETPSPITLVVDATPTEEIAEKEEEDYGDWVYEPTAINLDCYLHDMLADLEIVPKSFYPSILSRYRKIIEEKGDRLPTVESSYATKAHLLSMLDTLSEFNSTQSHSKRHRWLGYIQGTLCAYGLADVDTERNFTRSIFNGK